MGGRRRWYGSQLINLDDILATSPNTPSFAFKIKCCVDRLRPPTIANNGGFWPTMVCPLLTHMRHLARRYSTASAAIASTPDGMVRPSAFAVMVQSGP